MTSHAPRLNWDAHFRALERYMRGAGGVVHVHVTSDSPTAAFAKVVRGELARDIWQHQWRSVQIDPMNAKTRYLTDVVSQINKSADLRMTIPSGGGGGVTIGSDIRAGGEVTVTDVHVDMGDHADAPLAEAQQVRALCTGLEAALADRRVAIIFFNTHEAERTQLRRLYSRLWEDGLENLIDQGLLVIDLFNPEALLNQAASWPPDPDCVLRLTSHYDEAEATAARRDLAEVALRQGWFDAPRDAEVFATTVLGTSTSVRDVYVRLGLAFGQLGG